MVTLYPLHMLPGREEKWTISRWFKTCPGRSKEKVVSVRWLSLQSMEDEWTHSGSHQDAFVWFRKKIPPPWWVQPNIHSAYWTLQDWPSHPCIGGSLAIAHSCPMDGEGSAHVRGVCRWPGGSWDVGLPNDQKKASWFIWWSPTMEISLSLFFCKYVSGRREALHLV